MAASAERVGGDLFRLLHRGQGVREYSLGAARAISRAVPFDGVCVLTLDPATLLPTGEVMENGLPPAAISHMTEIELSGTDVNAFTALARAHCGAASLSGATGGDLDRSRRHREVKRPHGFGDELRAVLSDDGGAWGALTLLRADDARAFTPGEVTLVASLAGQLAEGLRRALLLTGGEPAGEGTGHLLLHADHTLAHADPAAEDWLEALGEPLPAVVRAVAARARANAAAPDPGGPLASARVRTATGQWLLVRGSALGDQTVVTLEPARAHELAPLIADAYGLTERERAVTQLVAQGLQTNAISLRLSISPWTVQDHLKSVFEKVGVSSRGELVASLFFEHYAPRLTNHV
jgi:DNA-binding CsgD family transcriptional regulator